MSQSERARRAQHLEQRFERAAPVVRRAPEQSVRSAWNIADHKPPKHASVALILASRRILARPRDRRSACRARSGARPASAATAPAVRIRPSSLVCLAEVGRCRLWRAFCQWERSASFIPFANLDQLVPAIDALGGFDAVGMPVRERPVFLAALVLPHGLELSSLVPEARRTVSLTMHIRAFPVEPTVLEMPSRESVSIAVLIERNLELQRTIGTPLDMDARMGLLLHRLGPPLD